MDVKLARLAPWPKGVDTRSNLTALGNGFLREAVNVTLDNTGKVKRRAGYTRRLAGDVHSIWANDTYLLAVLDGSLVQIDTDSWAPTTLRESVGADPLSYAQISNLLYYTSPSVCGRFDLLTGTHYSDFGPPNPESQPTLGTLSGGLPAGAYQVAITYVSRLGEESGSTLATTIELSGSQGLRLTNIPQGDADKIRIYCSMPSATSQEMFRQAEVNMGITEYDITSLKRGRQLTTQFLEPLPKGSMLRYYRGRLYVVDGAVVYYSQPIHYGLYAPDDGYLAPFPADISLLEPVEDGLYVGAAGTWFLHGSGPDEYVQSRVDSETPIVGTGAGFPPDLIDPTPTKLAGRTAYWVAPSGPVYALASGVLLYPARTRLSGFEATSGVSALLRDGGVDRMVTVLNDAVERVALGS